MLTLRGITIGIYTLVIRMVLNDIHYLHRTLTCDLVHDVVSP